MFGRVSNWVVFWGIWLTAGCPLLRTCWPLNLSLVTVPCWGELFPRALYSHHRQLLHLPYCFNDIAPGLLLRLLPRIIRRIIRFRQIAAKDRRVYLRAANNGPHYTTKWGSLSSRQTFTSCRTRLPRLIPPVLAPRAFHFLHLNLHPQSSYNVPVAHHFLNSSLTSHSSPILVPCTFHSLRPSLRPEPSWINSWLAIVTEHPGSGRLFSVQNSCHGNNDSH